jgi:hypothetical protein
MCDNVDMSALGLGLGEIKNTPSYIQTGAARLRIKELIANALYW